MDRKRALQRVQDGLRPIKTCPQCHAGLGDDDNACSGCGWGYAPSVEDAELTRLRAENEKLKLDTLTQSGQCAEEHIWPGHPKYEAMRAENDRYKTALDSIVNGEPHPGGIRKILIMPRVIEVARAALKEQP